MQWMRMRGFTKQGFSTPRGYGKTLVVALEKNRQHAIRLFDLTFSLSYHIKICNIVNPMTC